MINRNALKSAVQRLTPALDVSRHFRKEEFSARYYGVGNVVSVLVSVADSLAPKPLLHTQLGLEARVGIERGSLDLPTALNGRTWAGARVKRGATAPLELN